MECKECCREISKETYNDNGGLCYKCFKEKKKTELEESKEETCPAVTIVRVIAIIEIIASVIMCFMGEFAYIQNIILGVLLYAFGEFIRLLFDIKILLKEKIKIQKNKNIRVKH